MVKSVLKGISSLFDVVIFHIGHGEKISKRAIQYFSDFVQVIHIIFCFLSGTLHITYKFIVQFHTNR